MDGFAITVLYEDQRGPRQGFGLHALVKACVFDAINGERHRVEGRLSDHRPLKGAQALLKTCREEVHLIASDTRSVVAVFDDDAIREQLKLPRTATDARVEQEIRKGCQVPDRLLVVLLKKNMESVIVAAAECDPGLDPKRVDRAVRHKELLERDAILTEFSRERARPLRECVLRKMPSLKALIDAICRILLTGSPIEAAPTPSVSARPQKRAKPPKPSR
jgi:hypothetical protein